jgi:outer membrane protein TolC
MLIAGLVLLMGSTAQAQRRVGTILPERRSVHLREPSQLPRYQMPTANLPSTVSRPIKELQEQPLALDSAIRSSLRNLDVVRVLSGVTATNSVRSIYDVAIANTEVDQRQALFDPLLSVNNSWSLTENPQGVFDPGPTNSLLDNFVSVDRGRSRQFDTIAQINKSNLLGGDFNVGVQATPTSQNPSGVLNPLTRSSTFVGYTQPLLQGAGAEFNLAPIVIASINTERSYFAFKDAVQEHLRGIIEAYWSLVAARTDLWARQQQVDQLTETVRRVKARVRNNIDNRADLAQAELALANIKAVVVSAEGNVLLREAALRNIIGVSPSDGTVFIPTTPPINDRFIPDWDQLLLLAEERRPDLIELKLILEADLQQQIITRNGARPQLDAVAQYRWNGLEGRVASGLLPTRPHRSGSGQDWTVGINFSVPLGLRQARAAARAQDIVIARDRINLKQGLHAATHTLTATVRTLDQQYEQYLAYREARQAARVNLDAQLARWQTGQAILLNVLQAISDWGNTISNEANALTQYNTQLANLERQSGTILETHSVYFLQESQYWIGPHGRFCDMRAYPSSTQPTENSDLYEDSAEPAERSFDLQAPPNFRDLQNNVPYDTIELPTLEQMIERQKARDGENVPPPSE